VFHPISKHLEVDWKQNSAAPGFFNHFSVFGNRMKHSSSCFIYYFNEHMVTFLFSFSQIPSVETLVETIDLSDWSDSCADEINFLEHVEVSVKLNYTRRGDLLIKLVSPQGTVSNLTHYRKRDSFYRLKDLDWVLMTLHHWGENATGLWKLTLHNSQLNHINTGKVIRLLYFGEHARLQI